MEKYQGLLFVLKRSYICYCIIFMTKPLNQLVTHILHKGDRHNLLSNLFFMI